MNGGADDFLSYIREHHRELVPGIYACRIVPSSVRTFSTEHSAGVTFMLAIIEGPYKNREFSLRLCERSTFAPVVMRDMNAIAAWAEALGVTGKDLLGLVFNVGRATEAAGGVLLKLDVRKGRTGLDDVSVSAFAGLRKGTGNGG